MNLVIFLSLIGLIMVGWAFIYQTDSRVRTGRYLTRKSAFGRFRIETPKGAFWCEAPVPDGLEHGDSISIIVAPVSDERFYVFQPPRGDAIVRRNYLVSDLHGVTSGSK